MPKPKYRNPFRPGAGHMPPYLAGRQQERREFLRLLEQDVILENLLLTGLRGVGKTVLLDTLKPLAMQQGWLWVGADLSETTSLTESHITTRLLADLAVVTSSMTLDKRTVQHLGFGKPTKVERKLNFEMMSQLYATTPGLSSDKLKAVLETAWMVMSRQDARGIIFAYDEAQNMKDHSANDEFPLSLLLDVFQSIQKKEIPFMLLLTGLPTLFPKLVEARTFSERMFRVLFLDRLHEAECREAIVKPVAKLPEKMSEESVQLTIRESGGYPYFIQFICREVYDVLLQNIGRDVNMPMQDITRKLDTDFFAGRWARATDRQRDLLEVVASLPDCDDEFTLQAVSKKSRSALDKPFSTSQISQMFTKLAEAGLVYKNRHGKYSFAVPMLGQFIRRQAI